MTIVTKAPGVGSGRPLCVHTVRVSPLNTRTKLQRLERARGNGHPPEQCGETSHYLFDNKPYCRQHAGQVAIKILMGKN